MSRFLVELTLSIFREMAIRGLLKVLRLLVKVERRNEVRLVDRALPRGRLDPRVKRRANDLRRYIGDIAWR